MKPAFVRSKKNAIRAVKPNESGLNSTPDSGPTLASEVGSGEIEKSRSAVLVIGTRHSALDYTLWAKVDAEPTHDRHTSRRVLRLP